MGKFQVVMFIFLVVLLLVFPASIVAFDDYLELPTSAEVVLGRGGVQAPVAFDYFKLALQWPPSVPKSKYNGTLDFTIHGLWPSEQNGTVTINCPRFDPITDKTLLNRMQLSWPNLLDPKNDVGFWIQEWTKHGTCDTNPAYSQMKYLTLAVDLKDHHDVLQHLKSKGFPPNTNTPYDLQKFKNAIKTWTQKVPDLVCRNGAGGKHILQEIRICFDSMGTKVVDCHQLSPSCSSTSIYFPATPMVTF